VAICCHPANPDCRHHRGRRQLFASQGNYDTQVSLEDTSKKRSQNDTYTTQMYESEEVFDVIFVAGHQAAKVVQPCEQSLDFPSMSIPAQRATVLSRLPDAIVLMLRDHDDALRFKLCIQPVAVVGADADQSLGSGGNKAFLKGKLEFSPATAIDVLCHNQCKAASKPQGQSTTFLSHRKIISSGASMNRCTALLQTPPDGVLSVDDRGGRSSMRLGFTQCQRSGKRCPSAHAFSDYLCKNSSNS